MDDVLIVGAGPAGSFAATIAARAGLKVRVLDRSRFPRAKLCGDTLNPGACSTLARHLTLAPLFLRSRPLDGMLLTGPHGVGVRGTYGSGVRGHSIERRVLDQWLLEQAVASGAELEEECVVHAALICDDRVAGVRAGGSTAGEHRARLVIAADGRHSRLAFGLGLAHHPQRPRRWAIGAYFEDVEGLSGGGEMHVRAGHYIGVAPMPGGAANVCLVVPYAPGAAGWRDAAEKLSSAIAADNVLAARFRQARMIASPIVLGPMAVDISAPGVPGLLLAGDAAGFIDPITGDGLTFALRGAELAVEVALDVLAGRIGPDQAVTALAARRRVAFKSKCRFNRSVRRLVSSSIAVGGAAVTARALPGVFRAMIRYAGDVCHHPSQ